MAAENLSKGGRRREQILSAAVELFGEVGYRGTSLRDIAQRVGITHPGLLYHFHSKQELLSAVLARRDETDEANFRFDDQPTARAHAERLLELADHNSTTPGIIELFATLSAESTDPEHPAHDYFSRRYRRVIDLFQGLFDRLGEEGDLRDGVDTTELGLIFTALMDGLQVQWLYEPEQVDVAGVLRRFFNVYLREPLGV